MAGENGLSENQFGFRKGRSTVDAIQAVVDIANKARRGTGKRKGFCAFIGINIVTLLSPLIKRYYLTLLLVGRQALKRHLYLYTTNYANPSQRR